ncbi:hypothetical protein BC567DRAFT_216817 [Phyllosticta citribraziliensis]
MQHVAQSNYGDAGTPRLHCPRLRCVQLWRRCLWLLLRMRLWPWPHGPSTIRRLRECVGAGVVGGQLYHCTSLPPLPVMPLLAGQIPVFLDHGILVHQVHQLGNDLALALVRRADAMRICICLLPSSCCYCRLRLQRVQLGQQGVLPRRPRGRIAVLQREVSSPGEGEEREARRGLSSSSSFNCCWHRYHGRRRCS